MSMKRQFLKISYIVISVVLIVQLAGCGYFLYPERRGQRPGGRVDPAVATLDALGLLVFVVPGVIAFVVDITNGTLYFPNSRHHASVASGTELLTVIRVNPSKLNEKTIQEIVRKQTGVLIRFDLRNIETYQLDRSENIEAKLVELEKSGYRIEIGLKTLQKAEDTKLFTRLIFY